MVLSVHSAKAQNEAEKEKILDNIIKLTPKEKMAEAVDSIFTIQQLSDSVLANEMKRLVIRDIDTIIYITKRIAINNFTLDELKQLKKLRKKKKELPYPLQVKVRKSFLALHDSLEVWADNLYLEAIDNTKSPAIAILKGLVIVNLPLASLIP